MWRKVLESVPEVRSLDVKFMDDAGGLLLPSAKSAAILRIDEYTKQ